MTKTKRIASTAAAAVLALSMVTAASSFAAFATPANNVAITITNTDGKHTYQAYQLFSGDVSDGKLTNIQWGSGVSDSAALLEALKAYVPTGSSSSPFADCTDANSVANVLRNFEDDSDDVKAVAKIFGKYLSNDCVEATVAADATSCELNVGEEGYWLVKDKDDSLNDTENTAYTSYILKVLGSTSLAPKSALPTVEKKVEEDEHIVNTNAVNTAIYGAKYNDVADYSIGEAFSFALKGTMPANIGSYTSYKYAFHDTLSKGFTISPMEVTVAIMNPKTGEGETGYDTTTLNEGFKTSRITNDDGTTSIDVSFDDILGLEGITVNKDTIVLVRYTAWLDSDAVVGLDGNENEVYLTYSNNPNWDGTPGSDDDDEGKTPKDKVVVFTYEFDGTKVDSVVDTKKLKDAEFKLYYTDENSKNHYVQLDADNKVTGWTTNASDATVIKSAEDGTFKIIGLDNGTYYLQETKAPDGYNLPSKPFTLVITSTTVNNQAWNDFDASKALTALSLSVDGAAAQAGNTTTGVVAANITNTSGSKLPSTGGIGTKIFYVGGGAVVLASGVLLVTKKRMKNNAE